ncbi:CAP-Gly domain-containing linker protein 1 [Biomphalaria glabrata]|nr:CAP-Gly domain-containing linker protein 1 [Biomphalaria glabrata]
MYAKKVYDFVFTLSLDNIPGVGSYNLLGDHHGPIKDLDLNRTRSLNRLDQSGRTYKDIGYRLTDKNEMPGHIESLHMKLKEAQDQIKSLDILLTGANKQKDMFEINYKVLEQKLSSGEQKSERARK